jgi:hypothetical protein
MDQVGICNLALGWLGVKPITAMDDATTEAELCDANWDVVRDAVLEARQWTFAVERAQLAADASAPISGWTARYQVPADCIRVLSADLGDDTNEIDWQREGQFVVCDEASPIFIRYLKRVEDTLLWSPSFCLAMACRLALVLVVPLVENRALQADLWKLYAQAIRDASALDGMQGRSTQRQTSTLRTWRA